MISQAVRLWKGNLAETNCGLHSPGCRPCVWNMFSPGRSKIRKNRSCLHSGIYQKHLP